MNLAIDRSADCWTLTLERPDKANALSAALVDELRDSVAPAGAAGSKVLVLRGNGRNFSAGVDLMAACRWRVVAPGTTFRMPGLAFGIVLGTRRFAALVGRDRARAILEGLETFDAERAAAMGFASRIAAMDEWPAVVAEAQDTARILPAPSRALLYGVLDTALHDADLASLTRSAADAGLKDRIRDYLAAQQAARAPRP